MILLNVGSKFISIQFSKSTEEYLKYSISKQLLVFAMAWMGTRDIYTALALTAIFVVLSDHLFNEESHLCVVPHEYRVLNKNINESMDTNNDGKVSEAEYNQALAVLEKAKKEKQLQAQKDAMIKFDYGKNQ
jgi:lipoate synthase